MPRESRPSITGQRPNTSSFSEFRTYRLKDGCAMSLKTEVTLPFHIPVESLATFIDESHDFFRLRAMEDHNAIAEVGELRKREAKHFFAAPFTETSVKED